MIRRCNLRHLALFAVLAVAACRAPANRDERTGSAPSVTASAAVFETDTADSYRHGHCGPGIQACTAAQSGQACNPNNLNVICTPQSNGSFCCLAIAQQ